MSLLLDALKKAAQEKEQQGGVDQGAAEAATATVEPPAAEVAAGSDNDQGEQLMSLLQGQSGPAPDEVEGFEPFEDDAPADGGFSLSLIDEEERAEAGVTQSATAVTGTVANETGPVAAESDAAPVTFEFLDDDAAEPAVAPKTPQVPTTPSTVSLTLLDDDEPLPDADASLYQSRSADAEAQPAVEADAVATAEQAQPVTSELAVETAPAVETSAPEVETRPEAVPEAVAAPVAATVAAVVAEAAPVAPQVAPTAPPTAPQPVPQPQQPPVEPQPAAESMAEPGMAAAPDLVLDALQRRRSRRRVLVLSSILVVVAASLGWGYVMLEEQALENDRLMNTYQVRTPRPAPAAVAVQPTVQATAPAAAGPAPGSTTLPTAGPAPTSGPATVQVTPPGPAPMTAKQAVETALERDIQGNKAGNVISRPDGYLQEGGGKASEIESRSSEEVTVSRRVVDQSIIEQQKLDIASRSSETIEMQAYRAFKNQDYSKALRLYQHALKRDPLSRDAVMGLAAIAATERDFDRAAHYYKELLDYDPTDRAAFEGLIGLPETGLDLVDMESRLRNYLAEYPDSMRAQARLGRTLARQKRWQEAQQAFFNAYRLNTSDASYALNVAIALDHLRKYDAAKQYYERTLMLEASAARSSGLNLVPIRQRLDVLSQLETR